MTFKTWVDGILAIGNQAVIPLIIAAAFVVFLFGLVKYFFFAGESEEGRRAGKQLAFWGLLGLALLFAAWGIVNLLLDTLGFAGS